MFCPKADHFCKYTDSEYTHLQWKCINVVRDWLVDIETVADLTDESRTKLAQANVMLCSHL